MKKILLVGLVLFFCCCSKEDEDNVNSENYYLGQMLTSENVQYGKVRFVYKKDKWIHFERIYLIRTNTTYILDEYYSLYDIFHYGNDNPNHHQNYIDPKIIIDFKKNENTITGTFLDNDTGSKGTFVSKEMSEYDSMQ